MRKGFTLIELLIVMAVIAILVAIAVPAFRGMRQEAQTTRVQGDIKVIKIALESYYKTNGSYPTDNANEAQDTLLAASPRILESNLYDPFGSTSTTRYVYTLSGNYYIVYSVGPDGTGSITVNSNGVVSTSEGTAADDIWVSNGYQR